MRYEATVYAHVDSHVYNTAWLDRNFRAESLFKLVALVEQFLESVQGCEVTMELNDNGTIEHYSKAHWMHSWTNA